MTLFTYTGFNVFFFFVQNSFLKSFIIAAQFLNYWFTFDTNHNLGKLHIYNEILLWIDDNMYK